MSKAGERFEPFQSKAGDGHTATTRLQGQDGEQFPHLVPSPAAHRNRVGAGKELLAAPHRGALPLIKVQPAAKRPAP